MSIRGTHDFVELAREGLAYQLNETIINEIVEKSVETFRQRLLDEIKVAGIRICLQRVETFRDLQYFRDELRVHLDITTNKEQPEVVVKTVSGRR